MSMKKVNLKSKKTWKNILVVGLATITFIGAIVGLSTLFKKNEEPTKEIRPSYAIGGLTEQGAYLDTEESIYTKDAFECKGLNVKVAFDNNISYRIFFYDFNDNFVNATEKLTTNYSEETDLFVKSARIVITPNEDSKISWYEINGYSKQLTISVNKDSASLPKTYTYDFSNEEKISAWFASGKLNDSTVNSSNVTKIIQIDISNLKSFYSKIYFQKSGSDGIMVWFLTEKAVIGQTAPFCSGVSSPVTAIQDLNMEIPSDCNFIAFACEVPGEGKVKTPDQIVFSN